MPNASASISRLLQQAVAALRGAGVAGPERDATRILAHCMGLDLTQIYAPYTHPALAERLLTDTGLTARFTDMIADRARGRPVSKIIGLRAFWKHDFLITDDVLDPRPETETLVEAALEQPFEHVLDLGTGSGCILLSLLAERPNAQGVGVDISDAALAVAAKNAARLGIADRLTLKTSNWFAQVEGSFDLIVSNPPYIAESEMAGLSTEVRDYDPLVALSPGGDGLDAYRAILRDISKHLTIGGRVAVEIGPTQGEAVCDLMQAAGLAEVKVYADLDGRDRVVQGHKPL